jgi:hypothetical protein
MVERAASTKETKAGAGKPASAEERASEQAAKPLALEKGLAQEARAATLADTVRALTPSNGFRPKQDETWLAILAWHDR